MLRKLLFVLLVLSSCGFAAAQKFEGPWITPSYRGILKCDLTDLGKDKKGVQRWKGRFYGYWQGINYSYNVQWTGPANKMKGTATIDGRPYTWTGKILKKKTKSRGTVEEFTGEFRSALRSHTGTFKMSRTIKKPKA